MEQFGPLPLPCQQKTDDVRADDGDLFEVEGGPGTAKIQLFSNLPEVLGLRGSDHADAPPSAIRPALALERHPSPAFAGDTSNPRASTPPSAAAAPIRKPRPIVRPRPRCP